MSDSFKTGYEAQHRGEGFLDNPYDSYSVDGRRWIDGYVKSMQDCRCPAEQIQPTDLEFHPDAFSFVYPLPKRLEP